MGLIGNYVDFIIIRTSAILYFINNLYINLENWGNDIPQKNISINPKIKVTFNLIQAKLNINPNLLKVMYLRCLHQLNRENM